MGVNDLPNPKAKNPKATVKTVTNIKATVKRSSIIVGDFSYYSGENFESRVTHHYSFLGDKLIIGKFCQIGANVEFVMNGANHQMNSISTFPFYMMDGWKQSSPTLKDLPLKGDTVVGNDVWMGQNVTILPGVHIGDGAIIGANSVVTKDIPAYAIAAGNPCRIKRMRFDETTVAFLEKLQWWNHSVEEIEEMIPFLTSKNIDIPTLEKWL